MPPKQGSGSSAAAAGGGPAAPPLRVAWVADPKKFGKKPGYPKPALRDRLQREGGWSFVRLSPEEVRGGALQTGSYDIFVVPGGYAPNFAAGLGERGGQAIRDFVRAGGGYFGVCAGAYLGSMWGFELLPVDILDIDNWDRGTTLDCRLRRTAAGLSVLGPGLPEAFGVPYANGPLFEILDSSVEAFVDFESDLRGKSGKYPPLMRGSPACVAGPCGKGRVVLLSPHMEGSPPVADAFRSLVGWTAGGCAPPPPPPPPPAAVPRAPAAAKAAAAPRASRSTSSSSSAPTPGRAAAKPISGTEAAVIAAFRQFDDEGSGRIQREVMAEVLQLLGSGKLAEQLGRLVQEFGAGSDGSVNYEEFISWAFGTPWIFGAGAGAAESDGEEDAEMDKPSLVRLRSLAQFEVPPEALAGEAEDGELDGALAPPPPAPPPLELVRSCSDGCSGRMRQVSEEELQSSVVAIQRAARARQRAARNEETSGRRKAEAPAAATSTAGSRPSRASGRGAAGRSSGSPAPQVERAQQAGAPAVAASAAVPAATAGRTGRASGRAARSGSPAPQAGARSGARPSSGPRAGSPAVPRGPPPSLLRRGGLDYVCALGGPILLTAPHSMKLVRGGGDTGERVRNHKRERWTAEMAVVLARELQRAGLPASLMFWNRAAAFGQGRLDPNYLLPSQFAGSPWHCALHRWALGVGQGLEAPLLHVDLHGKVSEKLHLDLGIAPLECEWPPGDQAFVHALKSRLASRLDEVLEDSGIRSQQGRQIAVDPDPVLHGFWGQDTVATISHQSVLLGIPAVQFEMPPRLRERLATDAKVAQRFAAVLAEVYQEVVVPWWASRRGSRTPWPRSRRLDPALAAQVEESGPPGGGAGFDAWSERLFSELVQLERANSSEVQI